MRPSLGGGLRGTRSAPLSESRPSAGSEAGSPGAQRVLPPTPTPACRARPTAQRRRQGGGRGSPSPLASHLQLRFQTCSSPPRPAPPHPGPPARRPPAFLSPLSRRTGRPGAISGSRAFSTHPGRGRGSRWLRRDSWAAGRARRGASGAPPSPSPPWSPAPARPSRSCRAARAAGRTLRRVGRCLCARGRARGGGGGAGGRGPPRRRPDMAEVSIDQSKLPGVKEGRGRGVERARGSPPLPSPPAARVPCGQGRRPWGPRGPGPAPTWCRPALAGKGIEFGLLPWHLGPMTERFCASLLSCVRRWGWLCRCSSGR